MFNAGRRLGGAIGVAVAMTTIVLVNGDAATSGGGRLSIAACRAAFLVSAAVSLAGVLIAWSVTDADAASTIPAPRPRKRMKTAPSERPLS
jgi:hypothetical protein